MNYFRLARDPSQGVLPDPFLGQNIGPVPGYGVSYYCILEFTFILSNNKSYLKQLWDNFTFLSHFIYWMKTFLLLC